MHTTDVFIDFSCPWSYIAHHRLAIDEQSHRSWRARAFQLNPDISAGGLTRTTYRINKFGSLSESQRREAVVVEAASNVGLEIDFASIEVTPNTRNAHRATKAVGRRGVDTVAFAEAIFAAYFINGVDIGSIDALVAIADRIAVELHRGDLEAGTVGDNEVSSDIAAAHNAGLTGVPFFVTTTADPQPMSIGSGSQLAPETNALDHSPGPPRLRTCSTAKSCDACEVML